MMQYATVRENNPTAETALSRQQRGHPCCFSNTSQIITCSADKIPDES